MRIQDCAATVTAIVLNSQSKQKSDTFLASQLLQLAVGYAHPVSRRASTMKRTLEHIFHRPTKETPATWVSDLYIDRFLFNPAYTSKEAQTAALKEDILHLLQEVNLVQPITTYDYWLDVNSAALSRESYQETMDSMGSNFVEHLQKSNFTLSRAITEHLTINRVTEVIAQELQKVQETNPTALPATCFLITSPPDLQEFGYHGSDCLEKNNWSAKESHHTFFYLLTVDAIDTDSQKVHITATQYRTWHSLNQLLALHEKLGQPISNPSPETITQELYANVHILDWAEFGSVEQLQEQLRTALYAEAETWKFNPDQAPQLPEEVDVLAEAMTLFEEWYVPAFFELLHSLPPETLQQPNSPERIALNERFNHLFDFYFRAVEKRIREVNINPLYPPEKNSLKKLIGRKGKSSTTKTTNVVSVPLSTKVSSIATLYQQDQQFRFSGARFTRAQKLHHLKNLGSLIEVSNFAFGSAQCLLLSPFTIPMNLMKVGFNPAALSSFSGSLSELSSSQLQKLSHEIQKSNYQEISFTHQKTKISYMVPNSYGSGCYIKDGVVYGPCNIPLSQDPLALNLTAAQFSRYIDALNTALDQEKTIKSTQELLETAASSDTELSELHNLYKTVVDQLCKPTLSIDELINDDIITNTVPAILHNLHQLLKHSVNPLQTLTQVAYSGRLTPTDLRV